MWHWHFLPCMISVPGTTLKHAYLLWEFEVLDIVLLLPVLYSRTVRKSGNKKCT